MLARLVTDSMTTATTASPALYWVCVRMTISLRNTRPLVWQPVPGNGTTDVDASRADANPVLKCIPTTTRRSETTTGNQRLALTGRVSVIRSWTAAVNRTGGDPGPLRWLVAGQAHRERNRRGGDDRGPEPALRRPTAIVTM